MMVRKREVMERMFRLTLPKTEEKPSSTTIHTRQIKEFGKQTDAGQESQDILMSFSSPGQGSSPWLASLPVKDWLLDPLLRSGDSYVPVALVPTNGGSIPTKNPKVIQVKLQKASSLLQKITEVRQFGRGGILCCSADQDCVRELLNCSEFAAQPDGSAAETQTASGTSAVTTVEAVITATLGSQPPEVDDVDGDIRRLITTIPVLYRVTREQAALRRRTERKRRRYLLCAALLVPYMILLALLLLIRPPERPKKLQSPLLCTTSSEAYVEFAADLPPDGICTFIFCESVYKKRQHPFVNRTPTPGPVPFDIDFDHFTQRQFLFLDTLLGVSFALNNGDLMKDYQTPEFRQNLDYTWNQKIYQYGVASMRPPQITKNDIRDALTFIKSRWEEATMKHVLLGDRNKSPKKQNMGVGFLVPKVGQLRKFFTPHIFIAISHISIDDYLLPECRIMPTSVYEFPANVTDRYFMSVCLPRLPERLWQTSPDDMGQGTLSTLSFSFTMRARCYWPRHPDPNVVAIGNFGLFNPCKDGGIIPDISPGKACNVSFAVGNTSRYYPTYFVRVGYDKRLGRTLVFDPLTGMRVKICTAKRIFLRVNFTVSAYDVEYDVWRYTRFRGIVKCDHFNINGTNERTQFPENIRGLLNRSYVTAPDVQDCITHW
ncbi:hypothetical protein HPB51_009703 [Rhipicephalus microplus]|uniref:Uncharacterized protein n=1 Tax=Rhipicephalus microplus TaxID=6941 RepID=A0A9J6EST3_RHIMP|nr:hypothetical protein HPB51_009703 [Rhipicephalus microplus]